MFQKLYRYIDIKDGKSLNYIEIELIKILGTKAMRLLFNLLRICLTMGLLAFCFMSFLSGNNRKEQYNDAKY